MVGPKAHLPPFPLALFPFYRVVSFVSVRIGQSFHAYFHYKIVKIHNPYCWIKPTRGGTANS